MMSRWLNKTFRVFFYSFQLLMLAAYSSIVALFIVMSIAAHTGALGYLRTYTAGDEVAVAYITDDVAMGLIMSGGFLSIVIMAGIVAVLKKLPKSEESTGNA